MSATEKVIRQLACELWEQAGRPDGRSDEFWFAVRYESERREETGEELGAPVRRPSDGRQCRKERGATRRRPRTRRSRSQQP